MTLQLCICTSAICRPVCFCQAGFDKAVMCAGVSKAVFIDEHLMHKSTMGAFAASAGLHVGVGCGALVGVLVLMFSAECDLRRDAQQLFSHSKGRV